MATYSPQAPDDHGLAANYNAAAGGGDRVPPGVLLHIKNTNAAVLTVTLTTPGTVAGDLAIPDRTFTVPATTGERFARLTPYDVYRDPADGLVGLGWSVTSGVSFAVIT
jgi:hypothetical protein